MDLFDHFDNDIDVKRFNKLKAAKDDSANITDEESVKPSKLDTFKDIIPSIIKSKQYILEDEGEYQPFLVNLALSQYDDAIFYANEMNMNWQLPNRLQYDFYFHSLRSKWRGFPKWGKVPKHDDLQAVMTYFNYSKQKAAQALRVLTEQQLEHVRKVITIGDAK